MYVGVFVLCFTEQLKGPLEEYVNKRYPGLIKIVRNQKREGLIRARIEGWKVATGEVTGFFDAHVEFTPSWYVLDSSVKGDGISHGFISNLNSPPPSHCTQFPSELGGKLKASPLVFLISLL